MRKLAGSLAACLLVVSVAWGQGVVRPGVVAPSSNAATVTNLAINVSASGDTTLVTATGGQTSRLYGLVLINPSGTLMTLRCGSTVLFAVSDHVALDLRANPYWSCAANEAIVLNLAGAVAVYGALDYTKN